MATPSVTFNILLFDGFETLDALGPAEVIGRIRERYRLCCVSLCGGAVTSAQGIVVQTGALGGTAEGGDCTVLLIPGGQGTRALVSDAAFIEWLRQQAVAASHVLTVCTGSALLAKTGLLDGLPATTNKIAFDWVASLRPQVDWRQRARWVRAGDIYTSSGISAGIDMTLGFVADRDGLAVAEEAARQMEYVWNRDSENDPFAGEG